jgi:hypothetical protein
MRPLEIGELPDGEPHHVAIKTINDDPIRLKAVRLSDPLLIRVTTAAEIAAHLSNRLEQEQHLPLAGALERLGKQMRAILSMRITFFAEDSLVALSNLSSIERVAYLARAFF